jgi:hypothetical protein
MNPSGSGSLHFCSCDLRPPGFEFRLGASLRTRRGSQRTTVLAALKKCSS